MATERPAQDLKVLVQTEQATATMDKQPLAQLPPQMANSNGQSPTRKANGSSAAVQTDDLDERILCMEKAVGTTFYRSVLREYGRVNQPKLIRDAIIKRKVLQMLESVARGIDRLEAVTKAARSEDC